MLISIIMAVYNNEKYFPLAVKSIVEQSYTDFELIIIDDGSTDRTPVIADEIAAGDCRIKVIHQSNQWIYASFNRGIEEAEGEYIYIVNSDDRIRQGSLALMAEKALRYRPDVIWTKVLIHECDEEQNIISYNQMNLDNWVDKERYCPDTESVHKIWPFLFVSSLAQNQANLYRSELMKRYRFRNDVYGADTLFNLSIAPEIKTAYVMKEPVYDFFIYQKEGMNASTGRFYPYEHQMFNEIYTKYVELFSSWNLPVESYKEILISRRIKQISGETGSLLCGNCVMSTEEKLEYILNVIPDETVRGCAKWGKREEELESRILSGIRAILVKEQIEKRSKMHFVYELLDSLLRYEKEEEDFRKIEEAVWNPLNPARIGRIFYDKLEKSC
ncbi:MAG: glycosyltransferase family 2 protein [Dorea sp.]|nr:glycosyltransferase family 2 protein [Dorea sp.]